jgi:hypothetical protein
MSRKKTDATKRTVKDTDPAPAPAPDPNAEPDSPILRYLHSIDAKLDSHQRAASQERAASQGAAVVKAEATTGAVGAYGTRSRTTQAEEPGC